MKFLKLLLLVSLLSTNIYADENKDPPCKTLLEGCLKGDECQQVLEQAKGKDTKDKKSTTDK